jgi:tRNA-intron endonuclease, archaea type
MTKIKLYVAGDFLYSNTQEAISLAKERAMGEYKEGRVFYNPIEALYLVEIMGAEVYKEEKKMTYDKLLTAISKKDKEAYTKYAVFKDLRKKGYVVKTALKFGAEFRVYNKGSGPGKEHAIWVVYPVRENDRYKWQEFSSRGRIAHSTNKKVLVGIVDGEGEVTYYEVAWKKL